MKFPENYKPNIALIESSMDLSKRTLAVMEEGDINTLIENVSGIYPDRAIAMLALHENISINEAIVKHVDSRGNITRTKDLKTRQRNATQTTGLSKSKRREIARRVVKTKKANPSIQTKANRKRIKAL